MYMTEWCAPLGTEPFEWQKRRMENLLPSVPDWVRENRAERRMPRKKEKKINHSPAPLRKVPGLAAL